MWLRTTRLGVQIPLDAPWSRGVTVARQALVLLVLVQIQAGLPFLPPGKLCFPWSADTRALALSGTDQVEARVGSAYESMVGEPFLVR